MLKLGEASDGSTRTPSVLEQIAQALDRPLDAFSDPRSCDQDGTVELLRLWASIKLDEDRLKVLSFLRTVVS